jgi:hypothetical protein
MVLDISDFTGGEVVKFVTNFATRLLLRKKEKPGPVMIIWEECQDVVPQKPFKNEAVMLGAIQRLIKKGRNFGIGTTLISQRPQAVNKEALNQTECMFAFQLTAPHDKRAISEWMVGNNVDLNVMATLPSLNNGECLVWSPSWMKAFAKTKCFAKKSFDGSKTPKFNAQSSPAKMAPIDLGELANKMKETIEKAESQDPVKLNKIISDLREEVTRLRRVGGADIANQNYLIEKNKSLEKSVNYLNNKLASNQKVADDIAKTLSILPLELIERHIQEIKKIKTKLKSGLSEYNSENNFGGNISTNDDRDQQHIAFATHELASMVPVNNEVKNKFKKQIKDKPTALTGAPLISMNKLGKCEKAILTALAQRQRNRPPASRSELGALTGYSPGGGAFSSSLSKLRGLGYIESSGDSYNITPSGHDALGPFEPLPTGEELLMYWAGRLPKAERAIFIVLKEIYPRSLYKQEIAELSGYAIGGAFNNALSALRTKKLITDGQPIKLQDYLIQK